MVGVVALLRVLLVFLLGSILCLSMTERGSTGPSGAIVGPCASAAATSSGKAAADVVNRRWSRGELERCHDLREDEEDQEGAKDDGCQRKPSSPTVPCAVAVLVIAISVRTTSVRHVECQFQRSEDVCGGSRRVM